MSLEVYKKYMLYIFI